MSSYSIVLYGARGCNGLCSYCCAHSNKLSDSKIIIDEKALIDKIKSSPLYKENENHHFDLWNNGDGLMHRKEMQRLVDILRKEWPTCTLSLSTNGLLLSDDASCDFLIKNNITFQVSHDGLGQFARTGDIDPLYFENTIALAKMGLFTTINCTLSGYNSSFIKNVEYFNNWRYKNHLETCNINIKLNHIYDSDYKDFEYKGKKYNSKLTGKVLDDYLTEFTKLAILFRKENGLYWRPYKSYILEQSRRFRKGSGGICFDFQSGNKDYTFVIDTKGNYSKCNLIDSSIDVSNSKATRPDYCKDCKYYDYSECKKCGSMNYPKVCEYQWKWLHTLESISNLDLLTNK